MKVTPAFLDSLSARPKACASQPCPPQLAAMLREIMQQHRFSRIEECCRLHPESIDALTFNLVPSLFGLFASSASQRCFHAFLASLTDRSLAHQLIRALVALPVFRSFVQTVCENTLIEYGQICTTPGATAFLEGSFWSPSHFWPP
jgi:hypothetical protein